MPLYARLRVLKVVQRSATKARTQALNQLRNLIATAPDELRSRLRTLKTDELISTCAAFRIGPDDDSLAAIIRLGLRELAQRIRLLEAQLERVLVRLTRITKATAPGLIQTHGVGPDTASTLLISAGDNPHRLHSESRSSASGACSAPGQPCSAPIRSRQQRQDHRHRLNRGGDRQANAALWRIAIVRMRSDPNTRTYVDKRVKEGKTKTEAIRCLKRYIARELYAKLPREALA